MAALREILVAFGVTVDTKPIEQGNKATDKFKQNLERLGTTIATAFAFDKIKDFVLATVGAADAIGDQAARLNLSSHALEQWTYAAQFADIQANELDGIFNKLARSSVEAGDASSEQGKVLKKLGVDVKDANGNFKDTGTLFEEVGLALGGMNDKTEQTALSFQFFGKAAGPKVLQIFKDGPDGIKKFREEFEQLGGGMGDFVEQAGEIDDNMHRLDLAWTSAKAKLVGLVAPAVNLIVTGLTKLSALIAYAGKNTYVLQAAIVTLSAAAAAAAAPVIAAWLPVLLPFLKMAAILALVVLFVEDLIGAWKGADSLIGRVVDKLFGAGATARTVAWIKQTGAAFGQFWDELTGRPDQFAEKWAQTSAGIENDLTSSLGPTFAGVIRGMLDEGVFLLQALTGGWENFAEKCSAIWDGIGIAFTAAWDEIKFFGLGVVASLDDAVTSLLKKIPGGLGDSLAGSGHAVADLDKLRDAARLAHAAEFDEVGRRLTAPAQTYGRTIIGPPPPPNIGDVNVYVGSGQDPARAAARVVEGAMRRGMGRPNAAAAGALERRGRTR